MRRRLSQDVQTIFGAFDAGDSDKTSRILRALFKFCVYILLCYPLGVMLEVTFGDGPLGRAGSMLALVAAFSWLVSVVIAVLMGAHTYGKGKGSRGLIWSIGLVMGKTFKYVLLPAIVITAVLIFIAVITKQPTFQ